MSGDSVQNIIGDIFSVGLGYILGTVFLAVELWWLSILWTAVSEVKLLFKKKIFSWLLHFSTPYYQVICVLYMRDSLLMTITTILVHSDKLKSWQLAKLPKCESQGWFISRLFGYNNVAPMKTY